MDEGVEALGDRRFNEPVFQDLAFIFGDIEGLLFWARQQASEDAAILDHLRHGVMQRRMRVIEKYVSMGGSLATTRQLFRQVLDLHAQDDYRRHRSGRAGAPVPPFLEVTQMQFEFPPE